ncbi:MAG: hypothetical protein QM640_01400 [Niabella sp.]
MRSKLFSGKSGFFVPALTFLVTLLIFSFGCQKSAATFDNPGTTTPETNTSDSLTVSDSTTTVDSTTSDTVSTISTSGTSRVINVGSGSGSLTIDGSNLVINGSKSSFQNGDVVKIKSGSYSDITIKNISVSDGTRVTIVNDGGLVLLDGTKQMTLSDLNNVTISGTGVSADGRGFVFQNNSYRAVVLSGTVNNFTLQNAYFKNVSDYVITYSALNSKVYTGSDDSYTSNLAFLNIDAENVSTLIQLDGDINTANFTGLVKGIEIAHISCINSPNIGSVVYMGDADNYNIHDNYVNNVNTSNNNHNGIFFIHGNGKFYNNKITSHQGNGLRAWIYSISGTSNVEIYNNIVYNSRKYSAFEVQVPAYMYATSVFAPANAKVYNNTVGKMNTEGDSFPGRLLDVYNTYGTLQVSNNLVFSNNDNQILNNMSSTTITNTNNVYVSAESDAIVNTTSFTSKISGVGASL